MTKKELKIILKHKLQERKCLQLLLEMKVVENGKIGRKLVMMRLSVGRVAKKAKGRNNGLVISSRGKEGEL